MPKKTATCKDLLGKKIGHIVRKGEFGSKRQAVAVAYHMIEKKHPGCVRTLEGKRR